MTNRFWSRMLRVMRNENGWISPARAAMAATRAMSEAWSPIHRAKPVKMGPETTMSWP
jgi:hypothetical protein